MATGRLFYLCWLSDIGKVLCVCSGQDLGPAADNPEVHLVTILEVVDCRSTANPGFRGFDTLSAAGQNQVKSIVGKTLRLNESVPRLGILEYIDTPST